MGIFHGAKWRALLLFSSPFNTIDMNDEFEFYYFEFEPMTKLEREIPEGVPAHFVFRTNFSLENLHIYAHIAGKHKRKVVISPVSVDVSNRPFGETISYSLWVHPSVYDIIFGEYDRIEKEVRKQKRIMFSLEQLKEDL